MIENQTLLAFKERRELNTKPADTAVPAASAGRTNAVVLIATASVKGSGQE